MRLRIRVHTGSAKASLERKRRAVEDALAKFRPRGGQLVQGVMVQVIRELQGPGGTGNLSNSVVWTPIAGGFRVAATASYAGYVDKPTRAHEIRPVRAQALAFPRAGGRITRSRATGHVRTRFTFQGRTTTTDAVFVTVVHHPGTKGLDFTGATARRATEPLVQLLTGDIAAALRGA